jgi:hypothetical protein
MAALSEASDPELDLDGPTDWGELTRAVLTCQLWHHFRAYRNTSTWVTR